MTERTPGENVSSELTAQSPRGPLGIIFFIVFIDLMGFGIIIPLLPFYVKMPQSRPFEVTLLFSVYSICQFLGAPILGAISDRIGRRPVLAFSQLGSAVGYVLLGIATQFQFSPGMLLLLVYLSRVIDGFTGGNISTAQAYISDVTTHENRARGMGLIGAAFGIGFSAGPFLGGVLGGIHPSIPAYVAAGFSFAAAVLTFARLPESRVHRATEAEAWLHPRRFAPIFRRPLLVQLLVIAFFTMAAFVMMESTIGLFLNLKSTFSWQERQVGWFFAYSGLVIVIVQGGLIGRLSKRLGDWPLAIGGPLLVAVGMAGYVGVAYHPVLWLLLLAGGLNAAGRSFQQPTLSSIISKATDPRDHGTVFGFYSGLGSLGRVVGPIIAGACYPYLRHAGPFLTAGIMMCALALWMGVLARDKRQETRDKKDQTEDKTREGQSAIETPVK